MSSSVRLQDIADALGVSVTTVSLALRDSSRIGEDTRQQVQKLAEQMGYVPRQPPARPEIKQIIFSTPLAAGDYFYGAILRGVESECRQRDITVHFSQIDEDGDVSPYASLGREYGFLAAGSIPENTIRELKTFRMPMVLVDNNLPNSGLDRVLIENIGAVRNIVDWLVELGHERIAHFPGPITFPSFRERWLSYRIAMTDLGLSTIELNDGHWRFILDNAPEATETRLMREWLETHDSLDFTAIIAGSDVIATRMMKALYKAGIRVPDDVSVVGFDDVEIATLAQPPLSTCRVPREQIGAWAVRLLLERVADPDAPTQAVAIDTKLIKRDSVCALR